MKELKASDMFDVQMWKQMKITYYYVKLNEENKIPYWDHAMEESRDDPWNIRFWKERSDFIEFGGGYMNQ